MVITFEQLWESLAEDKQTPEVKEQVKQAYERELQIMEQTAKHYKKTEMNFFGFDNTGVQSLAHFNVKNLELENNPNAVNFHLQNVSQWVYAGGLLVENGKVSCHH